MNPAAETFTNYYTSNGIQGNEFTRGAGIIYQYKMQGLDADWMSTNAEVNRVTYTSLAPGRYIFEVRAKDDDNLSDIRSVELQLNGIRLNGGIYAPNGAPEYDGHRAIWIHNYDPATDQTFGDRRWDREVAAHSHLPQHLCRRYSCLYRASPAAHQLHRNHRNELPSAKRERAGGTGLLSE